MCRKWRYKKAPPPKKLPRPSRQVIVAGSAFLAGLVFWIAGFHWGVVLVVLGLAGLFLAGFWGVRATRGTDPTDGSQWAGASHSLLEVNPPGPPPS